MLGVADNIIGVDMVNHENARCVDFKAYVRVYYLVSLSLLVIF